MTTRIQTGGPATLVTASPTAARTTEAPARAFHELMAASSSAVVRTAEQAVTQLPGGPIIAAAVRSSSRSTLALSQTPEGTSSALAGSGVDGTTGAVGGVGAAGTNNAGVEGVLSQSSEQNLYYLGLQERISQENRSYTALSNVMKARHETLKNAIGNIR